MDGKKVAFVGAGSMAEAMISGLLKKKTIRKEQILVSNRSDQARLFDLKERYGVQVFTCKKRVLEEADIVVLAMKAKDVTEGLFKIRDDIRTNQLIISVIAGISTEIILSSLGCEAAIVRAMPNTSSSIGYSATTIAGGKFASEADIEIARTLFEAIGTVTIVAEEELHVTTGLAGSGPAYIYYIAEGMEKAATELGLNGIITRQLIAQTLMGAGQMLLKDDVDLSVLRKNVTSPGGTTEAGINQLQKNQVQEAFQMCIKSAVERSKELSSLVVKNETDNMEVDRNGI